MADFCNHKESKPEKDEDFALRVRLARVASAFLRMLMFWHKNTVRRRGPARRLRGAYKPRKDAGGETIAFDAKKGTFRHFFP